MTITRITTVFDMRRDMLKVTSSLLPRFVPLRADGTYRTVNHDRDPSSWQGGSPPPLPGVADGHRRDRP